MLPPPAINAFTQSAKEDHKATSPGTAFHLNRPGFYIRKLLAALCAVSLCNPAFGSVDEGLLDLSLEELLQVPVASFRSSIVRARDLKRAALVQQDSIVSEDISDFPDVNLAEALQRVPGIGISREGGEARQGHGFLR